MISFQVVRYRLRRAFRAALRPGRMAAAVTRLRNWLIEAYYTINYVVVVLWTDLQLWRQKKIYCRSWEEILCKEEETLRTYFIHKDDECRRNLAEIRRVLEELQRTRSLQEMFRCSAQVRQNYEEYHFRLEVLSRSWGGLN